MAKLKCKSCNNLFNLNGTSDINCPICGEKLENSFSEWIKRSENEKKNFDDYKRKKCYPSNTNSSSHSSISNNSSHSSSHNPYKRILKANNKKKQFRKRVYFYSAIILIHVIALFTNPDLNSHKKALHEKLHGKKEIKIATSIIHRDDFEDNSWKHESLFDKLESDLIVDDFYLFSVTKISWSGKTYPIGFAAFGYVYISDKVKEIKKQL